MRRKPTTAVWGLAVCALAFPLIATTASPVAASPTPTSAAGRHLKPFAAGVVQIDAAALADGRVLVTSDPVPGLTATSVSVSASGEASVTGGGGASPVPSDESTTRASVAVRESAPASADPAEAAVADATDTVVQATLTGTTSDGTELSSSDTVWVDEFAGETIVSASGEQDLRLQRVGVLEDSGSITAAQARALSETILGSTSSTESVTEATCAASSVCVTGTVLWTDSAGGTHPVDRAPVQIRDEEVGADVVVTTVTTDGNGAYTATIDNNDGDATGRDVYVRVLARGPGFTIAQHIDSAVTTNAVTGSTLAKDLTANNTADNNTAFSIQAALVLAGDEIVLQNGALFSTVPVVFPDPDGSFFDGTSLHLLALDRWDWDVSLHEYGHFVAAQLDIENNPGGFHSGTDNLSDATGSKAIGLPLAFGEGWPTFYAVSTLFERAAGLGIPNIGDTSYQDTEDQVITEDLEEKATLGEDNERTVMNALWDLYDSVDDGLDTVSLGNADVWDTLDDGDPTTLSEAYRLFSPRRADEGTNCIFTMMNVSPKVTGPAAVGVARPTITWRRGNGGTHRNNRFSVKFRDVGGTLLFGSPWANTTSYRPSAARWASIIAGAGGTVQVSVVGSQTDPPATGPYRSCTRSYPLIVG